MNITTSKLVGVAILYIIPFLSYDQKIEIGVN